MLIDVDIDKFSGGYLLNFPIHQFKSENDCKMAIAIVTCFAYDHELDPELDVEDMQEIIDKTKELAKESFTFTISEDDGIEVDI